MKKIDGRVAMMGVPGAREAMSVLHNTCRTGKILTSDCRACSTSRVPVKR